MNTSIVSILNTRNWLLQIIDGLSDDALNTIPEGFNNNIIWNMAHLVAAEQGLCYVRSGETPRMPVEFLKTYTRGTKPERALSASEIADIKAKMVSTLPQLQADLDAGMFSGYQAWTTPYGVELTSIEDALRFLSFHEGMHCGYILALKRMVATEQPA
jgi:hypothetical protein